MDPMRAEPKNMKKAMTNQKMKLTASILVLGLSAGAYAQKQEPRPQMELMKQYPESKGMPRFPDFGFMLAPGQYTGRVFLLSQNFPKKEPAIDSGVEKIFTIDFMKDWEAYAIAVRNYVFEGNTKHGGTDADFFLEDNKVRPWFHVPWQHWGPTGREGFHGLTQEGPIMQQMLAPTQMQAKSHAYAVGFYNAPGGYTIGRVWEDADRPNLGYMKTNGFPVGTVVGKVLFTTMDEKQVPYLKNPIEWQAYAYQSDIQDLASGAPTPVPPRVQTTVRAIQMDIMVRDKRADATGGWVFGTFVYNGELGNKNRWENLMPVGLMWGNDPKVTTNASNAKPTRTIINKDLVETRINESDRMPAMHLGFAARLNGPVDNPNSSCMSCHSTAEYPVVSAILPFLNNPPVPIPPASAPTAPAEWMRWFRNVPCATPFDPGKAISMDYSLQLAKSVQNFIEYKSQQTGGIFGLEYWSNGHKVRRGVHMEPGASKK